MYLRFKRTRPNGSSGPSDLTWKIPPKQTQLSNNRETRRLLDSYFHTTIFIVHSDLQKMYSECKRFKQTNDEHQGQESKQAESGTMDIWYYHSIAAPHKQLLAKKIDFVV